MNPTIDAIVRRLTIFVGATFGTFVLYLAIGELSGQTDGTPLDDAMSMFVFGIVTKTTVVLTGGHAIALAILAWSRSAFIVPPLSRSAMSGVASATALDMVYVAGGWLSDLSARGVFRLALAAAVSLAICALRSRPPKTNGARIGARATSLATE